MTVLVTGAPGWLGTGLVGRLHERDEDVRCLTLPGVDTSPLDPFDVETVAADVTDPGTLERCLDGDVEVVVHAAGIIHPSSLFGASQFHAVNAAGTRNLLEAAAANAADRFVYVSSNAAQGFNASPAELMTEAMPCRPESDYGRSKFAAEQHVRRFGAERDLAFCIVRPCWYYGPRQPERMARLMRMIAGGHPVVFGDGTNLRSMTYVPSLVDALCRILDSWSVAAGETYWIADERPYPTEYVYRTIADCLGVADSLRPIYVPRPVSRVMEWADGALGRFGLYEQNVHVAGEMSRTIACDPSKAADELGWEPPTDLRTGMAEAVAWAREHDQL